VREIGLPVIRTQIARARTISSTSPRLAGGLSARQNFPAFLFIRVRNAVVGDRNQVIILSVSPRFRQLRDDPSDSAPSSAFVREQQTRFHRIAFHQSAQGCFHHTIESDWLLVTVID